MKSKLLLLSLCFVAASVLSPATVQAQKDSKKLSKAEKKRQAALKTDSLLTAKTFCFVPRKVAGSTQIISGYNEMKVTPTEIDCLMPFFGVGEGAFKGGMGSKGNPMGFTSDDFTYVKQGRAVDGGNAIVSINVKKASTDITYKFTMEVYDDQTAILSINAGSMRPFAYEGEITPIPDKKK